MGGGIAGSAFAYTAARAGAEVTVLDAARGGASHVPLALVNPVRGQGGRSSEQDRAGAAFTLRLLETLQGQSSRKLGEARRVLRPLPDEDTTKRWAALPAQAGRFVPPSQVPVGWHAAYEVAHSGWVSGSRFLAALRQAGGYEQRLARVRLVAPNKVQLESGEELFADAVVWCAGAYGAALRTKATDLTVTPAPFSFRAGSVWRIAGAAPAQPLSFAVYAAADDTGTVLGSTFEAPRDHFWQGAPAPESLAWLQAKAQRLLGEVPTLCARWDGCRLTGLRFGQANDGVWELTGLGSKGFLLGPMLAAALWEDVAAAF